MTRQTDILNDDRGSALVEFALFLTFLVPVFTGVVDYSFFIQKRMQIQNAAAAAAAYGAVPGNWSNTSGMQTIATTVVKGVANFSSNASDLYVCTPGGASVASTYTCSGGVTPFEYVVVTTSGTVPAALNFPGIPANLAMSSTVSLRVQ
jgi:Flp pilus assembly protein TadG